MKIKCIEHLRDRLNYVKDEISKIKNDGDNKLIILAPERYHFDLENMALDMTSDKSLSKVEVVSFARFIYSRLFEEGNYIKKQLEIDEEIDIVTSLLDEETEDKEAKAYEILKLFKEAINNDLALTDKELSELINDYKTNLEEDGYDLSVLDSINNIKKTDDFKSLKTYLSNTKILCFGFNDFNLLQLKLLNVIENEIGENSNVEFLLSFNDYKSNYDETDIDYALYKIINDIEKVTSKKADVEVLSQDTKNTKKDNDLEIKINSYKDLHSECMDLIFKINNEKENNNYSYDDMYILVNGLDENKNELVNMLNSAKIPYSIREERTLSQTKVFGAANSLLNLFDNDYEMKDIINFFGCGLKVRKENSISQEEFIEEEKSINGGFKSALERIEKTCYENKIVKYDKEKFKEVFKEDNFAVLLESYIETIKKQYAEDKNLKNIFNLFNSFFFMNDEEEKTLETIIKCCDKVALRANDNETATYEDEFRKIIDDISLNSNKRLQNHILIDDFSNYRKVESKIVFYLNMKEESFKVKNKQTVIAYDSSKEFFNEYSKHLLNKNEAFEIASEKIILSYPETVGQGEEAELDRLFVSKFDVDLDKLDSYNYVLNMDKKIELLNTDSFALLFVQDNNLFDKKELDKIIKNLQNQKSAKQILEHQNFELYNKKENKGLEVDPKTYLHSDEDGMYVLNVSYSKFDTYLSCPYRYLLENIMKIRNVDRDYKAANVLGAIGHKIMEVIFDTYKKPAKADSKKKEKTYFEIESNDRKSKEQFIFDTVKKKVFEEYNELKNNTENKYSDHLEFLFDGGENEIYLKTIIKATLRDVDFIIANADNHAYTEISNEYKLDAVLRSTKDYKAKVEGYIDRVDLMKQGTKNVARILDYKTGKVPTPIIELGIHIQLYLYALLLGDINVVSLEYIPLIGEISTLNKKGSIATSNFNFIDTMFIDDKHYVEKVDKKDEENDDAEEPDVKTENVEEEKQDNQTNKVQLLEPLELDDVSLIETKPSTDPLVKTYQNVESFTIDYKTTLGKNNTKINKINNDALKNPELFKNAKREYLIQSYKQKKDTFKKVSETLDDLCDKMASGKFYIDPMNENMLGLKQDGCEYCKFKDICKYDKKEGK